MTEIAIQLHNSTQDVYLAGDKLQGEIDSLICQIIMN